MGVGLVGRDQYVKERNILHSYNKIVKTHEDLQRMKGSSSKHNLQMDAMRGSISDNETEMNVIRKIQKNVSITPRSGNVDTEANYQTADDRDIPFHALIKESLLLSDNEVTVYFMKFMVGIAIMNFPAQSSYHGVFNGALSTIIIVLVILKSNENLVKSIPLELMNQNLTLGQIAAKIFGSRSYQDIVDAIVILCQGSNYILYMKFTGVQFN